MSVPILPRSPDLDRVSVERSRVRVEVPARKRWPAVVLAVALTGCHLVDQRTFAPSPEAKPVSPATPAPPPHIDPRRPLLVIDYTNPQPEYHPLLGMAVHAADDRDREVQFDVVAVASTIDAASAAQDHAVDVMRAILADGVPATRVHLGLRVDPGLANAQVRVYVR